MAKKDETKNLTGGTLPPDTQDIAETSEAKDQSDVKPADDVKAEGNVVKPVAVLITLRSTHPQDTYGRCGYRFNKVEPVRIPFAALPDDAIVVFESDPYLECEYEFK